MPIQHVAPCHCDKGLAHHLNLLSSNERSSWLCQSQGNDAPAILVMGWSGLVRQLAIDCIDFAASSEALAKANSWLSGGDGVWHFGGNGSASWRIILPDGGWAATLMIAGLTLDEARKKFAL